MYQGLILQMALDCETAHYRDIGEGRRRGY